VRVGVRGECGRPGGGGSKGHTEREELRCHRGGGGFVGGAVEDGN
jgi:hypothetical protein